MADGALDQFGAKVLQTFLNATGAGLTVDGQFGPATIAAL